MTQVHAQPIEEPASQALFFHMVRSSPALLMRCFSAVLDKLKIFLFIE